jgi:CubicO group peptidase (beta-lactamase class C family)
MEATAATGEPTAGGFAAGGFEPVRALMAELGAAGDSCAVAAVYRGRLVADLWAGPGRDAATLTGVFSVTKGIAAICVALLVRRGLLDPEAPVSGYWPEFAARGKQRVTVGQLLSHQAGLPGPVAGLTLADFLEHDRAAAALAAAAPLWQPGSALGYHALTIGVAIEELVRRTAGASLGEFYEREVRAPLGADFYLGLPARLEPRVQPVRVAGTADGPAPPEHGYASAALAAGTGFPPVPELPNLRAVRAAGPAAFGGVGSARGLAEIYAACLARPGLLDAETLATVTALRASGPDLVLGRDARYALIFCKPGPALPFGSWQAFGHDGAGGSLALADPACQLSFAFVTAAFRAAEAAAPRAYRVLALVRECARHAT